MVRVRHIPERRCVACGQRKAKRELTRIVRTPQGAVQPDATGKSSGRGAYLCANAECWEKGVRKGGLERSLKVAMPPEEREALLAFFRERMAGRASLEG